MPQRHRASFCPRSQHNTQQIVDCLGEAPGSGHLFGWAMGYLAEKGSESEAPGSALSHRSVPHTRGRRTAHPADLHEEYGRERE